MNDDLTSADRRVIDQAQRETAAAFASWTLGLVRLAVAAGGPALVQRAEQALQAGGVPVLRVGLVAGGAELLLQVEGQPGGPLELWEASGVTGAAAPPH